MATYQVQSMGWDVDYFLDYRVVKITWFLIENVFLWLLKAI